MNWKEFLKTLHSASVMAKIARAQVKEKYDVVDKDLDAELQALWTDYKPAEPARTEPPATDPPPTDPPATDPPATDPPQRNEALEIGELCELSGCPERTVGFLREKKTVDQVREQLLKERQEDHVPLGVTSRISVDERDKFRVRAIGAINLRTGIKRENIEGAEEIEKSGAVGMSLIDLAKECLEMASPGSTSHLYDREEIASRALGASSGDFPYILAATQTKIMAQAYEQAQVSYPIWTRKGNVSDFKTFDVVNMSGANEPEEVPEGMPFKNAQFSEQREQAQVKTYGKKYTISRKMIVNDDLNAFVRIPSALSMACRRKVNKDVYVLLNTNAAMGDGVVLFHSASHRNLGTAGAISNTTLGEAFKLMRKQYDAQNNKLNLRPKYILVPAVKEQLALQFLSMKVPVVHIKASDTDIYRGMLDVVVDAVLDDLDADDYYFAADQNIIDTVTVFFLNGKDMPTLRQDESMVGSAQGRVYEVYMDYIPKAIEWRSMLKNAGS